MAIKDRSGRNWIPGLFAAFWILLAVFSAAYLFRIVTEPQAQRAESAVASPATTAATSAAPAPSSAPSALSEQQAEALIQASEAKDKEIGELRAAVQDLSGQVMALGSPQHATFRSSRRAHTAVSVIATSEARSSFSTSVGRSTYAGPSL